MDLCVLGHPGEAYSHENELVDKSIVQLEASGAADKIDHFCEDDPIVGRNTLLSCGNTTRADKHMFGSDMRSIWNDTKKLESIL